MKNLSAMVFLLLLQNTDLWTFFCMHTIFRRYLSDKQRKNEQMVILFRKLAILSQLCNEMSSVPRLNWSHCCFKFLLQKRYRSHRRHQHLSKFLCANKWNWKLKHLNCSMISLYVTKTNKYKNLLRSSHVIGAKN